MTTKVLRDVRSILAAEGLIETSCEAGGRHFKITALHPETGNYGLIIVHLGNRVKSRMRAGIRSDARAIRRGQIKKGGRPMIAPLQSR